MPTPTEYIVEKNRDQKISEEDSFTEDRYRQMVGFLPSSASRIVDVGCGTGRGGVVLRSFFPGAEIIGLDCVPERVAALPRNVYAEAICAFSEKLPFPDRSIQAIVAGEFLEHVPPESIEPTLCEFFRVLSLKGRFVLTTPNPGYMKNKLKNLSVMTDPCHVTQHHADVLRFRLRAVGFSGITLRGSGRVSRILGTRFPLPLYGSYLVCATKW